MVALPILIMPRRHGLISVYSDTWKFCTGCSIFQVQDGNERLIAYHSTALPASAQRMTISELELFGLVINITAFKHILRGTYFECYVYHSCLVQLMASKRVQPTEGFKKLMEKIADYSMKLGYVKGKELLVTDWLSRNPTESDNDPHCILPIAFTLLDQNIPEVILDAIHLDSNEDFRERIYPTTEIGRTITRSYARKHNIKVPDLWKNSNLSTPQPTSNARTPTQTTSTPIHGGVTRGQSTDYRSDTIPTVETIRTEVPDNIRQALVNNNTPDHEIPSLIRQIPTNTSEQIVQTHTDPHVNIHKQPKQLIPKQKYLTQT